MSEPITKDNFFAAVAEFHRIRRGGEAAGYPVITVKDSPGYWIEWVAYFDHIGLGWSFQEMRRLWNKGDGTWTVPAKSPTEFDPSFGLPEVDYRRFAEKESLGSEQTVAERRQFVDDLLQGFRAAPKQGSRRVTPAKQEGATWRNH